MYRFYHHLVVFSLGLTVLSPVSGRVMPYLDNSTAPESFFWPLPNEPVPKMTGTHSMVFDSYDTNGDELIDMSEFQHLFLSLFAHQHRHHVSPRKLEKIFHFLDLNGDKGLDREEFRKAFSHWLDRVLRPRTSLYMPICFESSEASQKRRFDWLSTLKAALDTVSDVQHLTLVDECNAAAKCPNLEACFKEIKQEAQAYFPSMHIDIHKDCVEYPITHERSILFNQWRLPFTKQHLEQKCQVQVILDSEPKHDRQRVASKVDLALTLARRLYRKYSKFFTAL